MKKRAGSKRPSPPPNRTRERGTIPVDTKTLVSQYCPLVLHLASQFSKAFPEYAAHVYPAGMLGLVQSLSRYNPERNPNPMGFARPRISGAMVDAIRANAPATRYYLEWAEKIEAISSHLATSLGRLPGS